MNVSDIDINKEELRVPCKLTAIFMHQLQLAKKYEEIEAKSGLLQTKDLPVDLNDPHGQARLKDFAWRVTEELTEATECLDYEIELSLEHYQEELIDALHFLVEMMLLADTRYGIEKGDILESAFSMFGGDLRLKGDTIPEEHYSAIKLQCWDFIQTIGKAMNCLKNKPWKQTYVQTDKEKFNKYMKQSFSLFIIILNMSGLNADSTFDLYIRKKEVNKFRQGSNY